jgi:hypothetical protein
MATFGTDLNVFQQIAGGDLKVLRDLVSSTSNLVKQPVLPTDFVAVPTGTVQTPDFTGDKAL